MNTDFYNISSPTHVPVDEIVRRVADRVIAETPFALLDSRNGSLHVNSSSLEPASEIQIAGRFNEWFYAGLLVGEGMARLGKALSEPAYSGFLGRQIDFVARHEQWFERQRALFPPRPRDVSRLGHYFIFDQLWASGFAAAWIQRSNLRPHDPVYHGYVNRFLALVDGSARDGEGVLLQEGHVRTDDAYLIAPGLLRYGLANGDNARVDDAFRQVLGAHRVLFDREVGLHRQSWCAAERVFSGDFWGRGNGWMVLAIIDLLDHAPCDHPRYVELLDVYRVSMAGLRRWQAQEGGWRQLLDHSESWVETSGTGMHAYVLARGVNAGWLDQTYAVDAQLAFDSLIARVDFDGALLDVCPATHQGNREHYLRRPRMRDDQHGYGPFLLAAGEYLMLSQKLS